MRFLWILGRWKGGAHHAGSSSEPPLPPLEDYNSRLELGTWNLDLKELEFELELELMTVMMSVILYSPNTPKVPTARWRIFT